MAWEFRHGTNRPNGPATISKAEAKAFHDPRTKPGPYLASELESGFLEMNDEMGEYGAFLDWEARTSPL